MDDFDDFLAAVSSPTSSNYVNKIVQEDDLLLLAQPSLSTTLPVGPALSSSTFSIGDFHFDFLMKSLLLLTPDPQMSNVYDSCISIFGCNTIKANFGKVNSNRKKVLHII